MSNKPNTKARTRPRPSTGTAPRALWQSPLVWVGGLVAVAIAVSIAVTVGGDDKPPIGSETAPAEALGDPLPRYQRPGDAVGLIAPAISAQTMDGARVQVTADGTARLLGFFAHWCSHCQAEVPRTVAWLENNDLPAGVELVAVSTSVDPTANNYPPSAWLEREGWPTRVLVDSETSVIANTFGLSGFPYWVALDGDGAVVTRLSGELTTEQFEALIAAITPTA